MTCEIFSLELVEVADGQECLNPVAAQHFETCLRCQAELAQYKKLLRALASLRGQLLPADQRLVEDIIEALRPPGTVHRLHRMAGGNRKAAYIGGIAAAATAGAAGAIVLATRLASRHRLAS